MNPPETRYARSGDVRIAYQVLGTGNIDLVFVPGFISNLDHWWDTGGVAPQFFRRLAGFSRLILFDKRGTGLSDRMAGIATFEERMDDVRAVMDAAGSQRAALFGASEGGAMSMLFAATYPSRASMLMLYGSYARHPLLFGEYLERNLEVIDRAWGTGEYVITFFAPSRGWDENFRREVARFERGSASPSAASAVLRMNSEIDVGSVLPNIRIPTLVLHCAGDPRIPTDAGRYLAANIAGAKYIEVPGRDHNLFAYSDLAGSIADEIEEFLTGARTEAEPDRVLATVMFTDIVDSTRHAAILGDREWRRLLDQHDDIARREIERFRGRAVKSLGDGFLAIFDGPARGVRCAAAISERVRPLGIAVRSGLHTGEIELTRDDVAGIAVHTAARVAELAQSGEVLVSSTVRDLVAGSGLRFADRGSHSLRSLPEPLRLFAAEA
jgi:class 3 adenylate cyclase